MLKNFQTTSIFLGLFLRKLEVQDFRNFADTLPWRLPEFDHEPILNRVPVPEAFDVFIPQAMRVHTTLSEHFGATALRVGVVTDIVAPVPSSANQRMQQHLLANQNMFGERLAELQLSALARTQLEGGVGINRRLGVRSMRTNQPGNPDLLLNINVDINTLAEEPYDVSTAELESFLRGVLKHMENNVPLLNERSLFE